MMKQYKERADKLLKRRQEDVKDQSMEYMPGLYCVLYYYYCSCSVRNVAYFCFMLKIDSAFLTWYTPHFRCIEQLLSAASVIGPISHYHQFNGKNCNPLNTH